MYEIKDIALELLGEPNKRLSSQNEMRFGTHGSMSIDLEKNTFFDHEQNTGGGVIDLLKRYNKNLDDYLPPQKPSKLGRITETYSYTDAVGNEVYQVCRFEPKTFRPRVKNGSGYKFGLSGVTPLPYNLKKIAESDNKAIIIVEGEKDADLLNQHGFIATCNSGGAGNWNPNLNKYFKDKNIILIPDNDDAGRKHSDHVIGQLQPLCGAIKLVRLPIDEKQDVSDYLKTHSVEDLRNQISNTGILKNKVKVSEVFNSWQITNPATLPARDFIYANHYIRKFASATVSQGGIGKSTLVLTECIAMAIGADLLGFSPKQQSIVIYFNAEDPIDEIQRRVLAICDSYNIDQSRLINQLFIASGREEELILAEGNDGLINEAAFAKIEDFCIKHNIDVLAADPLANMTTSPETNEVFKLLGKRVSQLADKCNISVEVVHHTRKLNGREASVEDSRGGSALINAVRAARSLNGMSPDEAIKAGLDTHINHFRIETGGKNNLSKPLEKAAWFEKSAVKLDNGDYVAIIKNWEFPDAFSGVTKEDARKIQVQADMEEYRYHHASADWVGKLIANVLGLNLDDKKDKSRTQQLLKGWISTDVLSIIEERRNGKTVKIVKAGSNNV